MHSFSALFKTRLLSRNLLIIICLFCSLSAAAKEYIIKPKQSINKYQLNQLSKSTNDIYKVTDSIEDLNLLKIDADMTKTTEHPFSLLKRFFDAEYVVENAPIYALAESSDPRRSEQWALDMVRANAAWDIAQGAKVIVAVIDTGVNLNHEDIRDNLWVNTKEVANDGKDNDGNGFIDDANGWDFNGNDKDPSDETSSQNPGHGTHCAGIIGARCNNNVGICGLSPKVSLMALRFLDKNGSGDLFASVKAIDYAVNNGAHVISASWGANVPQSTAQPIIDAIKKAEEKGVIFVAAAANDGRSNDSSDIYPANAQTPNMISVAASNSSDEKPQWSNFGRKVDIAAPGADILSTIPGGYKLLSGTSMATPYVAASVALLKSLDMSLTGAQARSILQSTGKAVNIETASNRRVDARAALEAVLQKKLTVVPAAATFKANDEFDFSAWGGQGPYKFSSSNGSVASIDEAGHLKALAEGDVTIEVTDASGTKAQTISVKISNSSGGGGGGSCPLPNELLCQIWCGIDPNMPWCKDLELATP
jgi:thermitase